MSNETDNLTATEQAEALASNLETQAKADEAVATPEQVQEWRDKAAKAQEHWDRLLRVSADFDNYKKRAARERQEAIRFANAALLEKLVPIVDNFEMALNAAEGPQPNAPDALAAGVGMIHAQLRAALSDAGLEEIDATGKPFDPNWHEAVAQHESAEVPEGHVLQQIRKGYNLKDRLLRPASVVVAKKPAA
jgi:molecular chaperone GrpE